jgi:hypothetical protein
MSRERPFSRQALKQLQEKQAAASPKPPSRTETPSPFRRCAPGRHPCRNGCAAWLRANWSSPPAPLALHPRSGKSRSPPQPASATPDAGQKHVPAAGRTVAAAAVSAIGAWLPYRAWPPPSRPSVPLPGPFPGPQCRSTPPRRQRPQPNSVAGDPPQHNHQQSGNRAAAAIPNWEPDGTRTRANRNPHSTACGHRLA